MTTSRTPSPPAVGLARSGAVVRSRRRPATRLAFACLVAPCLALCACTLTPLLDGGGERGRARQDVRKLMDRIAADVATSGPTAWLAHFLPARSFFMAADGALQFRGPGDADAFLHVWAPTVAEIRLAFDDVRVEVLSDDIAVIGATYEEEIALRDGTVQRYGGYFTGVAVLALDGWRLQHAHWSSPPLGARPPDE